MEIFNHVLIGKEVSHLPCLKNKLPLEEPDTIVVHYTAGSSARGAAEYLARPGVDASAHLVIGRRGEVYQLVPFNVEAWHAGRSSLLGRSDVNHYSIGIELDNLGRLRKEGSRFVAECGKTVRPEEVFADEAGGKAAYWHRYTAAQAEAIRMALPSSTPSSTRSRPGTLAWTFDRKAAHSSGVITPAESHRVTA